jgi:hypothetical protein
VSLTAFAVSAVVMVTQDFVHPDRRSGRTIHRGGDGADGHHESTRAQLVPKTDTCPSSWPVGGTFVQQCLANCQTHTVSVECGHRSSDVQGGGVMSPCLSRCNGEASLQGTCYQRGRMTGNGASRCELRDFRGDDNRHGG